VLGATDAATALGLDDEEADVAHALEVGSHRVGVQVQRLGHVGGGERAGRASQLEVDGVAGVVAERLQQVEPRRSTGVPWHATSLHGASR
jgi:xanthine dehydrogenase molybdopterin-binding subunit B